MRFNLSAIYCLIIAVFLSGAALNLFGLLYIFPWLPCALIIAFLLHKIMPELVFELEYRDIYFIFAFLLLTANIMALNGFKGVDFEFYMAAAISTTQNGTIPESLHTTFQHAIIDYPDIKMPAFFTLLNAFWLELFPFLGILPLIILHFILINLILISIFSFARKLGAPPEVTALTCIICLPFLVMLHAFCREILLMLFSMLAFAAFYESKEKTTGFFSLMAMNVKITGAPLLALLLFRKKKIAILALLFGMCLLVLVGGAGQYMGLLGTILNVDKGYFIRKLWENFREALMLMHVLLPFVAVFGLIRFSGRMREIAAFTVLTTLAIWLFHDGFRYSNFLLPIIIVQAAALLKNVPRRAALAAFCLLGIAFLIFVVNNPATWAN